jgi:hypothetical protein
MLLQQLAVIHRHAAVYGFAHVVHGEQGDLYGGQGFHLYAGGADGFYGGGIKNSTKVQHLRCP